MKRIQIYILSTIMVGLIFSCRRNESKQDEQSHTTTPAIEKAGWLLGEWESTSDGMHVIEIWEKENDKIYIGKSYSLRNGDTVSSEGIRLELQGDSLFYIPVVKNQNQGKVVKFVLTSFTDQQLTFENPLHDFPQKITYQLISNDSLLAEISGLYKGREQSEKFPMHRKH